MVDCRWVGIEVENPALANAELRNLGHVPAYVGVAEAEGGETGYDSTFLAVIGILDEIERQGNVVEVDTRWGAHAPPYSQLASSLSKFKHGE